MLLNTYCSRLWTAATSISKERCVLVCFDWRNGHAWLILAWSFLVALGSALHGDFFWIFFVRYIGCKISQTPLTGVLAFFREGYAFDLLRIGLTEMSLSLQVIYWFIIVCCADSRFTKFHQMTWRHWSLLWWDYLRRGVLASSSSLSRTTTRMMQKHMKEWTCGQLQPRKSSSKVSQSKYICLIVCSRKLLAWLCQVLFNDKF